MEAVKPSKVIFITDVPENLLDRRLMRQHFSSFGTVRRVSIDKESACCSVCYTTNEAAHKAFLEGTVMDNYRLKIMLGTSSGPSVNEKTEALRDTHSYDDLDMNDLDDSNDVFGTELQVADQSEKELFKMKKKIIRELHEDKKDTVKRTKKVSPSSEQAKTVKKTITKGSKLFKKSSALSMTSADLTKVKSLKKKFEMLEQRDRIYREKLKSMKLNVSGGTCPDMCPEKERIMRAYRKLWTPYEQRPGTTRLAPDLAVKEYSRSSANQEEPLPHELRPEPVLIMTMNYLILNIMPTIELPEANVSQWYDFLWDRLRGIRKDIVQQQLCSVNTANIIEQCARFHILCFDRLCGEDSSIFDEKINTENLNNCLQSLIHMYDDLHAQGMNCPNEPEFRAYEILLKLNRGDIIWEFQELPPHLQTASEILFALRVFSAYNSNLYSSFFKLVKETTYLNACLLQRNVSFIRSKALQSITKAFCRPQDQSFKLPLSYLKDTLKFDSDDDALEFCYAHGMTLAEDGDFGDLTMGKYDFSMPASVSSCLATSLNMIKAKRSLLPVTIAGPAGVPESVNHKTHSSFNSEGYLTPAALNAVDQIKKLEQDFGFVADIPNIEIDQKELVDINHLVEEKPDGIFRRTSANTQNTNQPITANNSSELFQTQPIQNNLFKTNPFPKEESNNTFFKSSVGLFKTIDNSNQGEGLPKEEGNKLFSKPSAGLFKTIESSNQDGSTVKSNVFESNLFKKDSETDVFKKPFDLPSGSDRFTNSATKINVFTKPSSSPFQLKSGASDMVFNKPSDNKSDKPNDVQLFAKSANVDVNIFKKSSDSNLFAKPSAPGNLFKKAIADSNIDKSSPSSSLVFQKTELDSSSGLFTNVTRSKNQESPSGVNVDIFGTKASDSSSSVEKPSVNVFNKPAFDSSTLFQRPSSFSDFMKPSISSNQSTVQDQQSTNFNFLQKVSEIKNTTVPPVKNSGFEKSFELFLKESEQQTKKRAADDEQEEERQKEFAVMQREKEKQRQLELEQQTQRELELQKQREQEMERKRQMELEMKRQREIEMQKQKELEEQRQRELEEERQRAIEQERLRQIEIEKQKAWEAKVKQDVINQKVEYDLQIAMNHLIKLQKKKTREHELKMIQLRKERELRKLRKVVKKKIRYIHARKCLKKWKDRVKRMRINKLEFPEVVLTSIENHIAVWGSIQHIKNVPYQLKARYETVKELTKDPLRSTDNLYLGGDLVQILNQNVVRPRFAKRNCKASTPLVWKVSFHLPQLPVEFAPVESQLTEFLRRLCYDGKQPLGDLVCLKGNGVTLHASYHLVQGRSSDQLQGSNMYLFVTSELWEPLHEACTRFEANVNSLGLDAEVVVLVYRSSYTCLQVIKAFNTDVRVIKWVSASDVSLALCSTFRSYFSKDASQLCYESLYEFLHNSVESVFLQLKLDMDSVVCAEELLAQLREPNFFIRIFNTLLSKLYVVSDPISLGAEFHPILFKRSSKVVNDNADLLESVVNTMTLPKFRHWPVVRVNKLKKLLKQFCACIDRSGRDELFTIVIRMLNPPKEDLEAYLGRVNWSNILLPCFLWQLKANLSLLSSAFLFYDREVVNSEVFSHWWLSKAQ